MTTSPFDFDHRVAFKNLRCRTTKDQFLLKTRNILHLILKVSLMMSNTRTSNVKREFVVYCNDYAH